MIDNFNKLEVFILEKLDSLSLSDLHKQRLIFEISEIRKQGSESLWLERYNTDVKFESNPNNLIVPWLLGMVSDDPFVLRKDRVLNSVKASKILKFKNTHGYIPHDLIKDADSPDIDLDCLPEARDPIKAYAIEKYGQNFNDGFGSVCSVGTWTTYKFKQAIIDAAIGLGFVSAQKSNNGKKKKAKFDAVDELPVDPNLKNRYYIENEFTTKLPDEVDELKESGSSTCKGKIRNPKTGEEKDCKHYHADAICSKCGSTETDGPTIGKLMAEHSILQKLDAEFPVSPDRPGLINSAIGLIGRIRNMGMHAGAIIITDRPLYGNIPMARSGKNGYWTSMWTEGRNTQLSKLGYLKWDILGLKTLAYIFKCCKLIEENRGISFGENMSGWDDIDPLERRAGHYFDSDGNKIDISMDDPHVIKLANSGLVDSIFQFDTDLAKQILKNGVTSFDDLLFYNAAGHPGPMECCWSDSLIDTVDGKVMIKNLDHESHTIKCLSTDNEVVITNRYKVVKSGRKKLLRFRLKDGKEIVVTPEHRILTNNGYKNAGSITISDKIAGIC